MKKFFLILMMLSLSACTVFEAGKIKDERKKLYERNNNREYCEQHPDRCVNNIPWS